ncbi:MAG: winged helix-turn-helix domain-containing protein [Bacteroidaceae bacterium]|nr:winged helix-turn-helix domain-containing protein [Bacteroidaceae bacterium]
MEEKKTTKKADTAKKEAPAKKACCKKTAAKAAVVIDVVSAGFKAGEVYEALNSKGALTVAELVKATKATEAEVLVGIGWLFKEGKVTVAEDKYVLA